MLLLGGLLYLLVYFTLVPLMGIISDSELENAISIVERLGPLKVIAKTALRFEKSLLRKSLWFKRNKDYPSN